MLTHEVNGASLVLVAGTCTTSILEQLMQYVPILGANIFIEQEASDRRIPSVKGPLIESFAAAQTWAANRVGKTGNEVLAEGVGEDLTTDSDHRDLPVVGYSIQFLDGEAVIGYSDFLIQTGGMWMP